MPSHELERKARMAQSTHTGPPHLYRKTVVARHHLLRSLDQTVASTLARWVAEDADRLYLLSTPGPPCAAEIFLCPSLISLHSRNAPRTFVLNIADKIFAVADPDKVAGANSDSMGAILRTCSLRSRNLYALSYVTFTSARLQDTRTARYVFHSRLLSRIFRGTDQRSPLHLLVLVKLQRPEIRVLPQLTLVLRRGNV
ncbi:uncharacterized protein LAESUDRAFT_30133 [Laetiporus sulphureus 93-53]|uniref:Uncharacterized protein n=1 Tax=Laetiporus sulphureus 93-53 TaxID=1314785 RepID=A0A165IIA6_9APHY|nr:uncharacterized protein LAESUDRAFT_30133 [Laetiporus sulphureus 93-53]KZT13113.1 hypothetical protein LAESUDRAFT_30133 [Laetiporus sulphureus 93-53]